MAGRGKGTWWEGEEWGAGRSGGGARSSRGGGRVQAASWNNWQFGSEGMLWASQQAARRVGLALTPKQQDHPGWLLGPQLPTQVPRES